MPLLIDPAKRYSKTLSDWVASFIFVPTLWPNNHDTDHMLKNMFKSAFLITYGFDGYDHTTNQFINTVSSESIEYTALSIDPWLAAASFMGLPTRTDIVEEVQEVPQKQNDSEALSLLSSKSQVPSKKRFPKISLTQLFLKNPFGGWQWSKVSVDKKILQSLGLALLIKFPVIFLIKVLALFLKFPLNVLKLLTEYLPLILITLSIIAVKWLAIKTSEYAGDNKSAKNNYNGDKKNSGLWPLLTIPLVFITLAFLAIHTALRIFYLLGRAFTSPEKSARIALAYTQEIQLPFVSQNTSEWIAFCMGLFIAFMSICLSATLWSLFLPLLFGTVLTYTTILQWPAISTLIGSLTSVFTSVGAGLQILFGNVLSGSLTYFGIQLSSTLLTAALTLGAIVTPVASILSAVADKLSDRWALFLSHEGEFFTDFFLSNKTAQGGYIPFSDTPSEPKKNEDPSHATQAVVLSSISSEQTANKGVGVVEGTKNRTGETVSQDQRLRHQHIQVYPEDDELGPDGQTLAEL